jgi:hypothetical protein
VSSEVLGQLLKAQPVGKVMWVAVRGRSMRPLLTGGESLKVERCEPQSLRPGEIAVMLRDDGALISHLVVATGPFRTESFDGKPDAPGLEPLGRAVAIRRGERVVPLPAPARPALLAAQRAWAFATRFPLTRAAYSVAGHLVASELTGSLRLMFAPVEVELLGPGDLAAIAVALSRWETLPGPALEALVRDATVLGARRRGELVGLAFSCPDQVLRHCFLQRRAQGLGLELSIVERALREAFARGVQITAAEIDASQPAFIAAARAFGLDLRSPRH